MSWGTKLCVQFWWGVGLCVRYELGCWVVRPVLVGCIDVLCSASRIGRCIPSYVSGFGPVLTYVFGMCWVYYVIYRIGILQYKICSIFHILFCQLIFATQLESSARQEKWTDFQKCLYELYSINLRAASIPSDVWARLILMMLQV